MSKRLTKMLCLVCGFIACVSIAVSFVLFENAKTTYAAEIVNCDIEAEYAVNDAFIVPTEITLQIDASTTLPATDFVLKFPDGSFHSESEYVLEQTGDYYFTCYATSDNKVYSATKTFVVKDSTWAIGSVKSSAVYKTALPNSAIEGIELVLAEGDAFTLNKVVNLNELPLDQNGCVDIATVFNKVRTADGQTPLVSTAIVRIIDAYDPSIYIDFATWAAKTDPFYHFAGASNQEKLFGLCYYSGMTKFDMQVDDLHGQSKYSTRYQASAAYGAVGNQHGKVGFAFNMNTGIVYLKVGSAYTYITNLYSEVIYGFGNGFKGFTTGEVYAQIQCYNYNTPEFNMEVTSLLGITGEGLKESRLEDTVYPVIEISATPTDSTGIYVQKDVPFAIPSATVYDVNFLGDLKTAVYYNYEDVNARTSVYVKDGKFVPDNYGKYTIVYTATDAFGNTTEETLNVNVTKEKPFTYPETKLTSLKAAGYYDYANSEYINTIPTLPVTSINDNSKITVDVTYTDPTGKTFPVEKDGDVMYIVPAYIGTYTINYLFKDNVSTELFSYEVSSVESGLVYFKDELKVSNYLIKNAVYSFEDYYVYAATANGFEMKLASLKVSNDGAGLTNVADQHKYKIVANSTVKLVPYYGDNVLDLSACPESKVVDMNYGVSTTTKKDYYKYFQGSYSNALVVDKASSIDYVFAGNDPVQEKMDFVNFVSLKEFQLAFTVAQKETVVGTEKVLSRSNLNDIYIEISQFGDSSKGVSIEYVDHGDKKNVDIYVKDFNGDILYSNKIEATIDGKHTVQVRDNSIFLSENVNFPLTQFTTDNVVFSIGAKKQAKTLEMFDVNGYTGEFTIQVSKIGNQNFKPSVQENNEAQATIRYIRFLGATNVNTEYVISPADAVSILNPVLPTDVKVTVTTETGDPVTAIDGTVLNNVPATKEYRINLSYIGKYTLNYVAQYSTGARTSKAVNETVIIISADNIKPVAKFEGDLNDTSLVTVKVNKMYKLASFTVSDNLDNEDDLYTQTFVYSEKYSILAIGVSEYGFTKTGIYHIGLYCSDKAGNYTMVYYHVNVVE